MPPVLEAWSLNHWTTREVPLFSSSFQDCKKECSCFPSGFANLGLIRDVEGLTFAKQPIRVDLELVSC